jgi:hypothetical protein
MENDFKGMVLALGLGLVLAFVMADAIFGAEAVTNTLADLWISL